MIDSLCEDTFISNLSMPTLQQLSSVQVILPLWYRYFSQLKTVKFDFIECFSRHHRYTIDLSKLVKSLKTQPPVEEILVKCLYKILQATGKWAQYIHSGHSWMIDLMEYQLFYPKPEWCVWLPSGEIDHKKSAAKMLSCCELDNVQKFVIMCAYCMESELKNYDLSSLPAACVKNSNRMRNQLMLYWVSYLENKSHQRSVPLEVKLARNCDNELAFDYFWNRLRPKDQISVAKSRLERCDHQNWYFCQKRLFSMISWHQQRRLLDDIPDRIILNFWLLVRSPKLVLWAWKHSKDKMTVKEFARIVEQIFHQRNGYEEEMQLLIDLWNTAPTRLKIYAAKEMVSEIVRPSLFGQSLEFTEYVESCDQYFIMDSFEDAAVKYLRKENALKFLCKFLSIKMVDERRKLMLENAVEFAVNVYDARLMDEAIKLCLLKSNDQLMFKKTIVNSPMMKKHLGELLGRHGGLKAYKIKLEFYSPDANVAKKFTKEILLASVFGRTIYFQNFNDWTEVSELIDESFNDNASLASGIKKELVSNYASKFRLHRINNDEMNQLVKILEHVYPPEELPNLRQNILNTCQRELASRADYLSYFDKNSFVKSVSWCANDIATLVKFKKSIPIDDMFGQIIREINDAYVHCQGFKDNLLAKFGDFMEWYFASVEELKKFKLRKLESLDLKKLKMFDDFLKYDKQDYYLKTLLGWFLHRNEVPAEFIREFKEKIEVAKASQ